MIKKLALVVFVLFCFGSSQLYSQQKSTLELYRSTTSNLGSSVIIQINSQNYIVQQSVGQSSVTGTFRNSEFIVRQGFLQPILLSEISQQNPKFLLQEKLQVLVYPNPFTDYLTVRFSEELLGNVEIEIYDVLGAMVFTKELPNQHNITIWPDLQTNAEYILKIKANKKEMTYKLVKK